MEVIPIGTDVIVGDGLKAKIISIELTLNRVHYRVAWWIKDERKTEWIESCEVLVDGAVKKQRIGFSK